MGLVGYLAAMGAVASIYSMMNWKTKAFIQRILHHLPGGQIVYHKGQQYVGGLRTVNILSKMQQGLRLISCLTEVENLDILQGKRGVEIGTGWIPIVPLLFWSLGLKRCDTFDIERLLLPDRFVKAAHQFAHFPLGNKLFIKEDMKKTVTSRVESLACLLTKSPTAQDVLEYCCIQYHAPYNAETTGLPNASVDLVFSNTVLEHVEKASIYRLFAEARRILRPGGYMLHLIDLSDHFSYQDPTITGINFMQFSDRAFAQYNTRFLFQNRLRASQWHDIFVQHGFEIRCYQTNIDQRALSSLSKLSLDRAFNTLSPEDICTGSICVLASSP